MVVWRADNSHLSPAVKEQLQVLSTRTRAMSQRVSELPSLSFRERFGMSSVGVATQPTSGPLRVTIHLGTTPDRTTLPPRRLSTRYTRSFTEELSVATARDVRGGVGGRRVRFELPPKTSFACGATAAAAAVTLFGNTSKAPPQSQQQVAGVDSWLRSRIGIANTFATTYNTPSSTSTSSLSTCRTTATPRVHDTGIYRRGTLRPTSETSPSEATAAPGVLTPGATAILQAARDGDEKKLIQILQNGQEYMVTREDVNAVDVSGRTAASHIASHGSLPMLEALLDMPGVDINKPDNEGNSPLHYASQAGHADAVNYILSHCTGVKVDARNCAGITPLMKAALQGRNRCAKLLILGGASPTLKDGGKGFRPDEWARHCGRYVCSEMIVKLSRHRLLERSGRWGSESDLVPPSSQPKVQSLANQSSFTKRLKQVLWVRAPSKPQNQGATSSTSNTPTTSSTKNPFAINGGRTQTRPLVIPKLLVTPVASDRDDTAAAGSATEVATERVLPVRRKHSRRLYFKMKK